MNLLIFWNEYKTVFRASFFIILTVGGMVINYVITEIKSTQIRDEVRESKQETIHSRIDGFAASLSAFRDEAYRLERYAQGLEEQNELLIECIQRNDCPKHPQLLKKKEKVVVDIMKAYQPIRNLLGEAYEGEK